MVGDRRAVRVCSFESRKQAEMRSLIERNDGVATLAASMRELPVEENPSAWEFARRLIGHEFDVVVFLTGVGARGLLEAVEPKFGREPFLTALKETCVIVRGPKPAAVLREWQVPFAFQVPEPNTWRELLDLLDAQVPVAGKRIAIQEYGLPSDRLYEALRARGANVEAVTVYRWGLPEDIEPLRNAIRSTIAGEFDLLLFTSAQQLHNILQVAEEMGVREAWLAAANRCQVGSIGPTATETLETEGLHVDLQPSHPKMGHLVIESLRHVRDREKSA